MNSFEILSRRGFLAAAGKAGVAAALASLVDIPLVAKRALAADNALGQNGHKLLFIFLRGANDALNSVIPVEDPAYYQSRPGIGISKDPAVDYTIITSADSGAAATSSEPTHSYPYALRLGNGFTGLHPALKFLAPVYNSGDLALIHRVGYPGQSRSHFDSQNYWETGHPNDNLSKDGILYRAIAESGLAQTLPLTAVSIQSSLPLILRGSRVALTNLSDPSRYSLLGLSSGGLGRAKAERALRIANRFPAPSKRNRDLLHLQYQNMLDTLELFADMDFSEAGNLFRDDAATDGDSAPYYLFPTSAGKNGGFSWHNRADKFVVPPSAFGFFENLKAAALVLNKTDAIIAGTELTGFDTHSNQGGLLGTHANLLRTVGWAFYALRKYFRRYADRASWSKVTIVTLSEFGRTTVQNSDFGTDHAEAGLMFVGGGGIKGYNKGNASGVFGITPNGPLPWVTGEAGTMFAVDDRYLSRVYDYRSVLGKIIRDSLGASPAQLDRIIPGYAEPGEGLRAGGTSSKDGTPILGEPAIV
jgi:uncharacterized protein (DUF1501 family)